MGCLRCKRFCEKSLDSVTLVGEANPEKGCEGSRDSLVLEVVLAPRGVLRDQP